MAENSIGIKTLDPYNQKYIPYYANDDNTTNFATSHGYSYHNGPEWVWVYGYFLLAIYEMKKMDTNFKNYNLMSYLAKHKQFIASNE